MDNNILISFSNFRDDGKVKREQGYEYIVSEDQITAEQYKDSEAKFYSLFTHWSETGAYINMRQFLQEENALIRKIKEAKEKDLEEVKTSLFLHDLPLQGDIFIFIGPESDHWLCLSLTD